MGRVKAALFFLITCCLSTSAFPQETLPYKNAKLPVEQRIADLLSRMTVEEKAAQLIGGMERSIFANDAKSSIVDQKGKFLPERASEILKNGLGQISQPGGMRSPREMAEFTNTIQKWARENTRL